MTSWALEGQQRRLSGRTVELYERPKRFSRSDADISGLIAQPLLERRSNANFKVPDQPDDISLLFLTASLVD